MFDIPAIIKIIIIFCLILVSNRLRVQLSISLLIGSLILGLWMGMNPLMWGKAIIAGLSDLQNISLILIVGLILVLSRLMKQSGQMDRMVNTFSNLTKDSRIVSVVMAAMIGLLPMPGGALFSAPMVETSLSGHSIRSEQKTAVNYWFRHIWEYWWPLYPGVVLAVALLEVHTWQFMAVMFPVTLISILAGIFFILRPMGQIGNWSQKGDKRANIGSFLREAMPIIVVILVILLQICLTWIIRLFGYSPEIPGVVSILPALLVSIIWVCLVNHIGFKQFLSGAVDKSILPIVLLIFAIVVFKEVMAASNAVAEIRDELMAFGIPVILVVIVMPFISGLITGIAVGFVGTSFPLIIPLFQTDQMLSYLSLAALAYTFGFMGMMLSPVHLCFLVTKDFYKASFFSTYQVIFFPVISIMIAVTMLYALLKIFHLI